GEWGSLLVTVDSVTNPLFGTGWQDPDEDSVSRADNGGAFDLGMAGSIAVTLPVGQSSGGDYSIEYFVNFIYATFLYDAPELSISGYSTDPSFTLTSGVDATGFPTWDGRTYTGTLSGISEESLTFVASTPGGPTG